MDSSMDVCAICLGSLTAGDGQASQALFTAECSHTFHFTCIATSVQHGNHICPTCRSTWRNLPSQFTPSPNNIPAPNVYPTPHVVPVVPQLSNLDFADDEPLPSLEPASASTTSSASIPLADTQLGGRMIVKALPEYSALSRSEDSNSFAVLVGICAPPLSPESSDMPDARAPIDLVAVLDVSGSMNGEKIRLLKEAMGFVVDNLGPADRLSVISFSTSARRVTPLRRMTDGGRGDTIQAVNSLRAHGSTNIIAGLKKAVEVLEQRRQKNPVASIILLSDGQDNQNGHGPDFLRSLHRLPTCIRTNTTDQNTHAATQTDIVPVHVHTFGFGSNHDATALHAIADGSGGTFSYIESIEIIQDAFAQCIGGLLSVVAQEVEIHVQSGSSGVRIESISSGRYRNTINNNVNQHSVVYVGDVYAEEEKQFLVYVSLPQALASSSEESDTWTTKLLEVKCLYKDPLSNESIMSEIVTAEIRRPPTEALSEADRQVHLEVDRERNRISIAEGIAQAQVMAERGELDGARQLLGQRRIRMMSSASAQAGDSRSSALEGEVREIEEMMASRADYEGGGRAFAYSKGSSHMYQRASTQAVRMKKLSINTAGPASSSEAYFSAPLGAAFGAVPPQGSGYQTAFMRKMVHKSQELRQPSNQGEQPGGSSNTK